MNRKQKVALSLNALGVALFFIWLLVRNKLLTAVSVGITVIFLAFLITSFILLAKSVRAIEKKDKTDS